MRMHTWTPSAPYRTTNATLLAVLQEAATLAKQQGLRLTMRGYDEVRKNRSRTLVPWPHRQTFLQHFGSWKAALAAAGV